jgi:molybdopterin-binding protein
VSIITVEAVETLSLAEGKRAYAVIKASSVIVGIDS